MAQLLLAGGSALGLQPPTPTDKAFAGDRGTMSQCSKPGKLIYCPPAPVIPFGTTDGELWAGHPVLREILS
ncbi:hypothetical protein AOQ73_26890 [Bradyrhizobium pachyrhizi]|nr:hypothetical protein AOQ73_26890 [Bradyrhizobium pachyrhizi]OMI05537.1 hypothetical protein BSN85_24935 [Bradyrhizobium brasilense]